MIIPNHPIQTKSIKINKYLSFAISENANQTFLSAEHSFAESWNDFPLNLLFYLCFYFLIYYYYVKLFFLFKKKERTFEFFTVAVPLVLS